MTPQPEETPPIAFPISLALKKASSLLYALTCPKLPIVCTTCATKAIEPAIVTYGFSGPPKSFVVM